MTRSLGQAWLTAALLGLFTGLGALVAAAQEVPDASPAIPVEVEALDPLPVHAIAMHGQPKYGPDFTHFDYVNPDAPKGGELRLGAVGSFDSFNPYIIRGDPSGAAVYETLLTSSADEAFTEYGLIAETLEVPEDRSWVIFNLRPEAR